MIKHVLTSLALLLCIANIFSMDFIKPQPHSIMYAPWREDYANMVKNTQQEEDLINKPCIFCTIVTQENNAQHFVLHHGKHSLIMLASQPYVNNGIHFLIVPYEHTREMSDLSVKTYDEENILTQKLCTLFSQNCNEIYINTNQGSSAGASIPNHHHKHVIFNKSPRYYNLIHAIRETKTTIDLPSLFHTLQTDIAALHTITIPQSTSVPCNKNCYYCSVIRNDDLENLIIHRGKYTSVMLSHYPTYFGEIDIIPNDHIESLETMPHETYEEINNLTIALYPILLKLLQTQDSNIGLISYGKQAIDKEHIKQTIIPRKNTWNTTSTTRSYHLNGHIKNFYNKLLSEWQKIIFYDHCVQQPSKL